MKRIDTVIWFENFGEDDIPIVEESVQILEN